MSTTPSPFPLQISEKENNPRLLAYLQQFGDQSYLTAEEINQIVQALNWLKDNGGGGGGPIDTSTLVTKLALAEVTLNTSGSNQVINLDAVPVEGRGVLRFTNNGLVSIAGFTGTTPNIWSGRLLTIINATSNTISLINNSGSAPIKYTNPTLSIPPNGVITVRFNNFENGVYLMASSFIDVSTQTENETAATATDLNTINNTKASTPRGLRWFWNALRAINWDWSGRPNFWGGIRLGSLTPNRWLRIDANNDVETFDGQALLEAKQDNAIVISTATFTAQNNREYNTVVNTTATDPTPVEGLGYWVNVVNATATIPTGGVTYGVGTKIFRHFHSGSWRNFVYNYGPKSTTSTEITFVQKSVHGTFDTPLTNATFTTSLTGAVIGLEQKAYHQAAVEPDYPVGFVKVGGVYVGGAKNMIFFEWVGGTRVEFYIVPA